MQIIVDETITISKSRYDALRAAAKALHDVFHELAGMDKAYDALAALRAAGVEMGEATETAYE